MIEYIALAASAGIFVLVLAGLGLAVVLRSVKAPRLPVLGQNSTPAATARKLLDAMTEVARDAAASKLVEAFTDPANNPHIPSFLSAKPEGKPGASDPKAP